MLRLEHIGIAVDDAQAMTRILADVLGRRPYKAEAVVSEGVRTLFLNAGGTKLELLEATSEDSPIAGFLNKRGAGMHHLAFEVADLDGEIARLGALGYEVLGKARAGADGKRIVFLHPRGTGRVLIELCQQADFAVTDLLPGDEPAPEAMITMVESPLSGALAHALGRYFRVTRSPNSDPAGAVSVAGSADAPHVSVRDCDAGDLEIRITLDAGRKSGGDSADSSGGAHSISIPSYLWCGLPDPWGFLADIVAVHVRSA